MNELIILKNDEALTDSLVVAESFNRRHDDVIKSIEKLIDRNNELPEDIRKSSVIKNQFVPSSYKDAQGRKQKKYLMNRDGFSLLVMGFNGKKAHEWKLKYISAFNSMEQIIREKSTSTWLETRQQGKLTRKAETDVIKELVEYAKNQGSTHSNMLYMTYSKLANSMSGIDNRETATTKQLNDLSIFENLILQMIRAGIEKDMNYKAIYQVCKERCVQAKEIAMIG